MSSPASGERWALRGYRWQYDHVAALVYDALIQDDFISLRLTDPEAGKVDDLVLVTRSGVDGYQFKSTEFDGFVTFAKILAKRKTRSGNPAPSLMRALADGWLLLRRQHRDLPVRVHLVTALFASVNDHLANATGRISPDHFQAFAEHVLTPLRLGRLSLEEVPLSWGSAIARLEGETGLDRGQFEVFARTLSLDLGARDALPAAESVRRADIVALSDRLYRLVSDATTVVQFGRQDLLDLMGWADRPRLRSSHEFPVDLDTYAPLDQAIAELDSQLARRLRGYIAVIGPPGAGKSTLLSQALSGRPERIVRYYAYVPGNAPTRSRLTAQAFLHDIVILLGRAGLGTADRHLASQDRDGLRRELHEQFDAASREFADSGRCTIVVVDGLDHVERDYPGNDGLLAELPEPAELPGGVLVIAGGRTLTPLSPRARQQVEEDGAVVNLEHHRLSTSAVLEICRRAPVTSDLEAEIHQRVAQLSAGYPLALSYLLNRLRDREGNDALEILSGAPPYAGDIAAEYRVVWDAVEAKDDVASMLAVCARLRGGFTTQWLETWSSPGTVAVFWRALRYLFRRHHDGWHFFHDSFRQFATDRTALDEDGRFDAARDARQHARVAELCSASPERRVAWEEIYHRYRAGQADAVVALGRQELFREQARGLRSPELTRADIGSALRTCADRCDVSGMLSMVLAMAELHERESALEAVDLPGVLCDAGLIDEAIDACGGDLGRRVPLESAYRLAERLGRDGRPEGRRIFDIVEHDNFDDREYPREAGKEDEAAEAWGAAAPLFRPLSSIMSATRSLLVDEEGEGQDRFHGRRDRRHMTIMKAVIGTLADQGRAEDLLAVDEELSERLVATRALAVQETPASDLDDGSRSDSPEWGSRVAALVALRVQIRFALTAQATDASDALRYVHEAIALLDDGPYFYSTSLDVAGLAARYDLQDAASELIADSPYANMLTVSELSLSRERGQLIDLHFRNWRLRFLLAYRAGLISREGASAIPDPVPPDASTPAGNDVVPNAAMHSDTEAIELAGRIDAAVRTLARLDAAVAAGVTPDSAEALAKLLVIMNTFRPSGSVRNSSSFHGMLWLRTPLMLLAVEVAVRYGDGLAEKLAKVLPHRFSDQPDSWPVSLRLQLATELRRAGVNVTCYPDVLAAREREAAQGDVSSRLQDLAELVRRHADDGDLGQAARLARTLVPVAFGVGYRKDYQFSTWVGWLGKGLQETKSASLVSEAVWLARLLVAADPMTEGAPGSAAADLPAAVAATSPIDAVRLFEFLVRQGTVNHMKALAALVGALVAHQDARGIQLASEFTAEVIASASNQAHPELARQISGTAQRTLGVPAAQNLIQQIAVRTDRYALPTARAEWRRGLGLEEAVADPPVERESTRDDDFGSLILKDGRRISRADVASIVPDVHTVLALRSEEDTESTFYWSALIEQMALSARDLPALEAAFEISSDDGLKVLTILAERARDNGDTAYAARLADLVLEHAPQNSWSSMWGSTRRRAHAVAIAAGGPAQRVAACRDLAQQVIETNWLASNLTGELAEIIAMTDPAVTATATWPVIRSYLDGIAETLVLPQDDVRGNLACRWWFQGAHSDQRSQAPADTPATALAELTVAHLAHPTWVIRDGTSRVVTRSLISGNAEVARALARFAPPGTADDLVETAGRCMAAARCETGYITPTILGPSEDALRDHPSQVVRSLASSIRPAKYRPLRGLYRLTVPPRPAKPLLGQPRPLLAPHEAQYQFLADGLGLSIDTLYAVAEMYAAQLMETLPSGKEISTALTAADLKCTYPSSRLLASRGAFGRVLADLTDAGLLDDIPRHVARGLRTVDLDLVGMSPQSRPPVLPQAPSAGHDQTTRSWLADTQHRLDEYMNSAESDSEWLLGAKGQVTVLNWDHPEEEFTCATLLDVGRQADRDELFVSVYAWRLSDLSADGAAVGKLPEGEQLLISNVGWTFHQLAADWISFRPDVARSLGWRPDPEMLGGWLTATGKPAVRTIPWVDGWWGRSGPVFDDTEGEGWAVTATQAGLDDLTAKLGTVTRVFHLLRWGRHDGRESERISAISQDTLRGTQGHG